MARDKRLLGYCGMEAHYDITETFTHRQETEDGRLLRADPEARFWYEECPKRPDTTCPEDSFTGCTSSWYGDPPRGWNPALAIPDPHSRTYEGWWDVS